MKTRDNSPEAKAHRAAIVRKSVAKLRLELLTHYSNGSPRCACCEETTLKFLTIDHIDGGGRQHRDKVGSHANTYRDIRKSGFPAGYQVLCWNCNCGRAHNNGVCPHKNKE